MFVNDNFKLEKHLVNARIVGGVGGQMDGWIDKWVAMQSMELRGTEIGWD